MNIFWGCILLGVSIVANAGDILSMNVNDSEKNFTVKLAANPTTGYQWTVVKFDKTFLTLSKSQYKRPQTNLIGAGGEMFFTFTLNEGKNYPEKTNMVFKYSRSWEPASATMKNVTVNFVKTLKN